MSCSSFRDFFRNAFAHHPARHSRTSRVLFMVCHLTTDPTVSSEHCSPWWLEPKRNRVEPMSRNRLYPGVAWQALQREQRGHCNGRSTKCAPHTNCDAQEPSQVEEIVASASRYSISTTRRISLRENIAKLHCSASARLKSCLEALARETPVIRPELIVVVSSAGDLAK